MSYEDLCRLTVAIDWPAWVQAVGSVAAILISVWIARAADRRAEKIQGERDKVQLQVVARVVEAVQSDIAALRTSIPALLEKQEWEQVHVVIVSALDMLNAIDVVQFGSAQDVRDFLYVRNTARRVLHFVHILLREPSNTDAVKSLEINCQIAWQSSRQLLDSIDSRNG